MTDIELLYVLIETHWDGKCEKKKKGNLKLYQALSLLG